MEPKKLKTSVGVSQLNEQNAQARYVIDEDDAQESSTPAGDIGSEPPTENEKNQ